MRFSRHNILLKATLSIEQRNKRRPTIRRLSPLLLFADHVDKFDFPEFREQRQEAFVTANLNSPKFFAVAQ